MANTLNAVEAGLDVGIDLVTDEARYIESFVAHFATQTERREVVDVTKGMSTDTALHEFATQAVQWLTADGVTPNFVLASRTIETYNGPFTWLTGRRKSVNHDKQVASGWFISPDIVGGVLRANVPPQYYYLVAAHGLAANLHLYLSGGTTPHVDSPWGFTFNPTSADRYDSPYDQFEQRHRIRDGIVGLLERSAVI